MPSLTTLFNFWNIFIQLHVKVMVEQGTMVGKYCDYKRFILNAYKIQYMVYDDSKELMYSKKNTS